MLFFLSLQAAALPAVLNLMLALTAADPRHFRHLFSQFFERIVDRHDAGEIAILVDHRQTPAAPAPARESILSVCGATVLILVNA